MKQIFLVVLLLFTAFIQVCYGQSYKIAGTGQTYSYNNTGVITKPKVGEPFYGQNTNHPGNIPSFTDNGNGTITDNVSGLMWEKTTDKNGPSKLAC